jgi:isocitrate/isopropylmalate dehydrogenase
MAWLMGWTWRDQASQELVIQAVGRVLKSGRATRDLGGHLTTEDFTAAVIAEL